MREAQYRRLLLLFAAVSITTACRTSSPQPSTLAALPASNTVWSVDLIRTLPGAQADYVRSIEANWANGRRFGRARGSIVSYRALVAPVDSARGWDVLLMTEYIDSAAYNSREAIFDTIFALKEFVRVTPARPTEEMRVIELSSVPMRLFVSQPR